MGAVYRATDTKLNREVAVKVLPDAFANDPDRLARFTREAQVLASLNHPNIATIYGIEERAIVMELVEGQTLADRIQQGAIPEQEALAIARQIATALETAHEKGIIHRDLKPANIKIIPDGTVKVLDFGLAKLIDPRELNSSPELQPTVVKGQSPTIAGMIMGTAEYMSPEQARGAAVDKRADIWSFGVVLYEMLTGKRLFEAETVSDTLAQVLTKEPDLTPIPANIRPAIQRCLQRDRKQRLRDIGDLWLGWETKHDPPPLNSPRWLLPVSIVCLALALMTALNYARRPNAAVASGDWQLSLEPPQDHPMGQANAEISPDGTMIAVVNQSGNIMLRRLNTLEWIHLKGTENVSASSLFWSPDNQSIGFTQDGFRLVKMRVPDGVPETVREHSGRASRGSTWNRDGLILAADVTTGLEIGSATGERTTLLLPAHPSDGLIKPIWPHFLPDGEHFLFTAFDPKATRGEGQGIYLAGWRSGQWTLRPVRLMANRAGEARFSPMLEGSVLFLRGDDLYAQHLNLSQKRMEGEAKLVLRAVASLPLFGNNEFSVSDTGSLVWRPGRAVLGQLTWFDRKGHPIGVSGPPEAWGQISLSPDGQRVAAVATHAGISDLLVLEANKTGFARLPLSAPNRLFTWGCLWVPRSNDIVYTEEVSTSEHILMKQSAAGGEIHELGKALSPYLKGFNEEGNRLLVSDRRRAKVVTLPLQQSPSDQDVLGDETAASLSPDGKWIVYAERGEVYVRQVDGSALRRQISESRPGTRPWRFSTWRADGKEILYSSMKGEIWSVAVNLARAEFSPPVLLFQVRWPAHINESVLLAITGDGSRILAAQAVEQPSSNVAHILSDWTSPLRAGSR